MADSSRNPGDEIRLSRLEKQLRAQEEGLKALRAEAEEALAAEQQGTKRLQDERKAVRKERTEAERAKRRSPGEPAPREQVRAAETTASSEERTAKATERAARARTASARAEQDLRRYQQGLAPQYPFRQPPTSPAAATRAYQQSLAPRYPFGAPVAPAVSPELLARYQRMFAGSGQIPPIYRTPPTAGRLQYERPIGPQPSNLEASAKATLRQVAGFQRLAPEAERAAQAELRFSQSLRTSAVAMGLNAQQMGRHGALTTEFIAAAARGEVTMRDLGNQIGLTIGKFAGWTIAATAVYGVVGALGSLGRGAIDAESGVNLVSRTLPNATKHADELKEHFAELSHQFNLPIDDVTQAVYGMGKVFGTQGGLTAALRASEQALFAVKVGELDAATATRYLTGIVSGFGLSAGELPAVFDAINQAQNRFGGNTGSLIAGVAKAAGAFRLVGGNYRQLIALIQTATRLTGTSGENVGTAIGRSAGVVLTPAGQTRLRAAKLNPDQPYMDLLQQAFKAAQGQSRERVQEIARALVPSGGQFARVFVPLLQNQELYNKVFGAISPEKSRGSATRELQRALRQPNEQLKQLVTNMEQLGVQLARVGAADPFLVLLRAINTTVHGVERLLNLVNQLPAPLRHAAVVMLEIAGIMRLMRRFDVGALLPGAIGRATASSPAQRLRRESQIYLDEQKAAFTQARNTVAQQAFRANYAVAGLAPGTEEHTNAAARARALEGERAALDAEIARIDEQRAVVAKGIRGAVARDLVATEAILAQNGIPNSAFGRRYGGAGFGDPAQGGPRYGGPVSQLGARGPLQRMQTALTGYAEQSRTLQRLGQSTSLSMRAAGTAAGLAAGSLRLTGAAIGGVAGGLRAFAAGAAAMIGPLDLVIATAIALPSIVSHYKQKLNEFDRASKSDFGGDPDAIRAKAAELRHRSKFQSFINLEQIGAERLANALLPGDPAYAPGRNQDALARELEAKAREMEAQQSQNRYLTLPKVREKLAAAMKRAADEPIKQMRAIRDAIAQTEVGRALNSADATPEQRAEARQYLEKLKEDYAVIAAMRSDVREALASLKSATTLGTYVDERAAHLAGTPQGRRQHDARALGLSIVRAREQVAEGTSTLKDALANIDKANQDVSEYVNTQLTRGLLTTSSAAQQGRLRSRAIGDLRRNLVSPLQDEEKRVRDSILRANRAIDTRNDEIIERAQGQTYGETATTQNNARIERLKRERDRIIKTRDKNNGRLRQIRAQLKEEEAIVAAFAADQRRQQFSAELEEFDARTGLQQAQTTDPVEQARILANRLHERTEMVRRGYKRHVQSLADLLNAEAREQEALNALAQQDFADFQSRQQLASARFGLAHIGDQRAVLQRAIKDARAGVEHAKKAGLSPNEIRSAKEALVRAQIAFAEYAREQAAALDDAQTNLALSLTEDPVKQAKIRLQDAYKQLRRAKTAPERINAQAEINNRRREVRNTRYQDQFDTIEFEAEMGRITRATEISRLQSLLKTIKGNRDFRRQLALRIHQLQKEADDAGEVELNVGDIKLPSIYDVRRLAKTGTANQLNVHQNFNIQVDGADDPAAVADNVFTKFAQHSTAGLKSASRSQGVK